MAFDALCEQGEDQLRWLGAEGAGGLYRLAVLDGTFRVDLAARSVRLANGEEVRPWWRVLALHYLGVMLQVDAIEPAIAFGDIPAARAYAKVYRQRVNPRLVGTAGRDRATLLAAADRVGGSSVDEIDQNVRRTLAFVRSIIP